LGIFQGFWDNSVAAPTNLIGLREGEVEVAFEAAAVDTDVAEAIVPLNTDGEGDGAPPYDCREGDGEVRAGRDPAAKGCGVAPLAEEFDEITVYLRVDSVIVFSGEKASSSGCIGVWLRGNDFFNCQSFLPCLICS
jgi:hypothetical protein